MTERSAAEWVQEGLAFHQKEQLEAAQERYRRALQLDPSSPDALHFLGMALFQGGDPHAAEDLIRQSLELKPGSATYRYNLGQLLEGQGRLDEALWAYDVVLTLDPGNTSALNERGRLLLQGNRLVEAETTLREAVASNPEAPEAHTNLGRLLRELGDLPGALERLNEGCNKGPGFLPAHLSRIDLLDTMGRAEEALAAAQQAEAVGLRHPLLSLLRAQVEESLGRLEEAADRLEATLEEHPDNYQAIFQFGRLAGRLGRSFPTQQVESLLQKPGINREARSALAFALGDYADSRKEHDTAFMYWVEGNQAEGHRAIAQELERRLEHWEALRQAFSPSVIQDLADWGDPQAEPIFVVGTPRSGTTLVEQILASHPSVAGVGEFGLVHDVLRDHLAPSDLETTQEGKPSITRQRSAELGRTYWNTLRQMAPEADRIVDKTPGNLQNLGLIWTLFPKARVVMTRRDLLDVGVSMFSQRFAQSLDFAFDLELLGRFLQGVQPQMAHWEKVLPAHFLLPLDYEDLIADPQHQVERLLVHCGLEWDPACLRFFETKRAVRTASQAQVRQPLYRSAIERWRLYEHHILPLARAAGMAGRLSQEAKGEFRSFSRLGERQLELGQIQEATASFRRALLWEPGRRAFLHERLGRALELAERFREAEACFRTAGEGGVVADNPTADGNLALARVRCLRKAGESSEAEALLGEAGVPASPARWTEEGWLALAQGEREKAESLFAAALAEAEADEARRGWAETLRQMDRRSDLTQSLEGLASSDPSRELPARLLGELLAAQGERAKAAEWGQRALELAPDSHRAHTLWARIEFLRDRPGAAKGALQRALGLCPDHAPALLLSGYLNLYLQRFGEAEANAREAMGLREDPEARVLFGRVRFLNGFEEEGLEIQRAARKAYPWISSAWRVEVSTLMDLNRRGEARELVEEARERFPEVEELRFQDLILLRQEGATAETLEDLHSLPEGIRETPAWHAEAGHHYDRLGEPDRAMGHFREANARHSRRAFVRSHPKEVALSRIARLRATVTEEWVQAWSAPLQPSGWAHPPVFLLGFPRSGTTLLDQVLSSHSQVEVLSERPVFEEVADELRRRYGGDLKGVAEMDSTAITEIQEYYRQVRDQYREDPQAPVVVDKMPLRTVEAGSLYRIFPDARFVFARRHPADCVLSAFMQLFAPNVAMANFHSLEDGAHYYRVVMELWQQYRRVFPGMRVHEVRYEELVEDFDAVAARLLEFLGLPWEEGVREFAETARGRGRITTPSRAQVTQPLYRHARYRWRGYRTHFGPAWEELRPFMEAAGYPQE